MGQLRGENIGIWFSPFHEQVVYIKFYFFAISKYPYLLTLSRLPIGGNKQYIGGSALTPEKIIGKFRNTGNIHNTGIFNIICITPIIIEHSPVAIGESRSSQIIVMGFLYIAGLLKQSFFSRKTGLAGAAFFR